jgi:hypothetical protein
MPVSRSSSTLAEVVAAVTADIERAFNDDGAPSLVVPALRPLLGGLRRGCVVVSRGPWVLQRGLLALLVSSPARIVHGPVDRRFDDHDETATAAATDVGGGARVAATLSIDAAGARDFVWHLVAGMARVVAEDLRSGQIEDKHWRGLADATAHVTGLPVSLVEGAAGEACLDFGDHFVRWDLRFHDGGTRAGHADILIDVTLGAHGQELDVLDGRTEPPTRIHARLVSGSITCGHFELDEACALDDRSRRDEERAAALAREREADFEDDAADTIPAWEPPAGGDGRG